MNLRFALRQLAKSPGFAITAILTLALGIGASTAIFSVVHAVLLSPLNYAAPDALVQVRSYHEKQGLTGLAPATFHDLRSTSKAFSALTAQYYYYVNLTGAGTPALLNSADVTADYFRVFAVSAALGRTLAPSDFKPDAAPVLVISHALWRSQFDGTDVIGRTIMLDGVSFTIVGVMPSSFKDPAEVGQLWRPMQPGLDNLLNRQSRYWTVFGRLGSTSSLGNANAELSVMAQQLAKAHPAEDAGWTLRADDLHRLIVGDYQRGLFAMLGAVGCLMLITSANVAGLVLVRTSARQRELAIRGALGASRGQLLFLLLVESLALALPGGIGGLLLASWLIDVFVRLVPAGWLPRVSEIEINLPVALVAIALTALASVVATLTPALTSLRRTNSSDLKTGTGTVGRLSSRRLRAGLVVAEIALSLILLAATGLLARSLGSLRHKEVGLNASQVLSLTLSLPAKKYQGPTQCWAFFARAERAIAALPGVTAAGFTHTSPFRWGIPNSFMPTERHGSETPDTFPSAFVDSVSVDYFRATGIPLRAGRLFTEADDAKSPARVILSATAAARYFGNEDPVGRSIVLTSDPKHPFEVVGVVGDVLRTGLTAPTMPLQVYRPLAQRTPPFATLMVKTSQPPHALGAAVQSALWQIERDLPITDVEVLETFVDRSVAQPRIHLTLCAVFASLGLSLAALGLYGVMAYSVAQRYREFGLRTALGASPADVSRLVFREASVLIALGLVAGLSGALIAARWIRSLIFETSAQDPLVFASAPLLLAVVALLASWLPARQASRVDPLTALRTE